MKIILSTRNPSKAEQIKAFFRGLPISVLTLNEAGIAGEAIEDGATLQENAAKKARFAWSQTKEWTMAEDTGLFINALNGQPGIYSARWAGENATTEEILNFVLKKLQGVPLQNRTANFTTVAVIISPQGEEQFFTGIVKGILLEKPCAQFQPKMPYSSIFIPDGQQKTWAEMTIEEENAISHRGKAFRQIREFLANILK